MRDGLSRGLLETIFALTGVVLVVADSTIPAVENGFAGGMALVAASASSYALRFTKPPSKNPEDP